MRTILFIFSLLFISSIELFSQYSSIQGIVSTKEDKQPIDSLRVDLLDSLDNIISSIYTDTTGFYTFNHLELGTYSVFFDNKETPEYISRQIVNIPVDTNRIIQVDLPIEIYIPCPEDIHHGVCPYCSRSKQVLPIEPMIVSYNFGREKRTEQSARKYDKKRSRKGYEVYNNRHILDRDGEVKIVVIAMLIKSEIDEFYDGCHHWFCKRCKKVF
ncbi:MAG: carboxypeptidase-like regulatory domain-containing protein [Saprospiraceae bacterium]|nr:carboxypeptidase-like regulatory domain-containing protein [Saprospiraceae bacterium]